MEEIGPKFFRQDPVWCARELIGSIFYWNGCEGRIVETEAYTEFDDPACHTWNRPSARDFIARHEAGTAYVYLNYGVHWLFNILVKGSARSGFVLFRALEPLTGLDLMKERRGTLSEKQLCSGPGKLTRAFGINGSDHGSTFFSSTTKGIRQSVRIPVSTGGRVGISRAVDLPWRFGAEGSECLSKKFESSRASD
jgi:DNA-3-methyladenine glycosylase